MQKKIVLLLAHQGYQATEYGVTAETVRKAGITAITASDTAGSAVAHDGTTTPIDVTINNLDPATFDGLFLIGGPGALEHLDTPEVHTLLKKVAKLGKPYGAICVSPRILAKSALLAGKQATGWDDDHELASIFNQYDVTYVHKPTVIDGTIVTASGPKAAQEFGEAIVQLILK